MKKNSRRNILLILKNTGITLGLFLLFLIIAVLGKYLLSMLIPEIKPADLLNVTYWELLLGILAAGLVLSQLEKEAEIEESQFILEQNKVFIENESLRDIEWYLDCKVREAQSDSAYVSSGSNKTVINRQNLINYLVYLEGLASEQQLGVITLEEIDNVFSYRYFTALNCIDVQVLELHKGMPYYLGCIRLYNEWYDFRLKACKGFCDENNLEKCIPLHKTPLFYMPDFEKYLEKPIETEFVKGKVEARIFGRNVGEAKLNSSNKITITFKPFCFMSSETKANVKRAILKEIFNLARQTNITVIKFEEDELEQEYRRIAEYMNVFEEKVKDNNRKQSRKRLNRKKHRHV